MVGLDSRSYTLSKAHYVPSSSRRVLEAPYEVTDLLIAQHVGDAVAQEDQEGILGCGGEDSRGDCWFGKYAELLVVRIAESSRVGESAGPARLCERASKVSEVSVKKASGSSGWEAKPREASRMSTSASSMSGLSRNSAKISGNATRVDERRDNQ